MGKTEIVSGPIGIEKIRNHEHHFFLGRGKRRSRVFLACNFVRPRGVETVIMGKDERNLWRSLSALEEIKAEGFQLRRFGVEAQ